MSKHPPVSRDALEQIASQSEENKIQFDLMTLARAILEIRDHIWMEGKKKESSSEPTPRLKHNELIRGSWVIASCCSAPVDIKDGKRVCSNCGQEVTDYTGPR